jgi:lipid A 3-O-deacylase
MRFWFAFFVALIPLTALAEPIVSEFRVGALEHDAGVISSTKEHGADANGEILFSSPSFLHFMWSPRPHIGATYNLWGQTSQVYTGITWNYDFSKHFFGELSFGPSVNNGKRDKSFPDRKDLGFPILFRESLSVGVRLPPRYTVSLFLDHISNGGLARYNGGLETAGVRVGFVF